MVEELYNLYYNDLVDFGLKFIKDKQAVQDITIDTIFKVDKRGYKEDVKAKLFFSVKNACIDHTRTYKNRRNVEKNYEYLHRNDAPVDANSIMLMYAAVDGLPIEARNVINLVLKDNKRSDEIGVMLNKKASTIRSIKRYALKLISNKIKHLL